VKAGLFWPILLVVVLLDFITKSLAVSLLGGVPHAVIGETVRFVLVNKGQVAHEFNLGDAAMHARHQEQMAAMPGQMDHSAMGHGGMDHGPAGHGGMQHDDPNMVMVAPGQRAELTWTFSQSMPIQFACNVPGHYQAGMVGTLTIAE
jgi:uncharacterized cupredoxin-like copper-binding protein